MLNFKEDFTPVSFALPMNESGGQNNHAQQRSTHHSCTDYNSVLVA